MAKKRRRSNGKPGLTGRRRQGTASVSQEQPKAKSLGAVGRGGRMEKFIQEAERVTVALDRNSLVLFVSRIMEQAQSHRPGLRDVWPWLSASVIFLIPTLAADFERDFLGIPAPVWEAAAIIVCILCAAIAAYKLSNLAYYRWQHKNAPPLTAADWVRHLLDEMTQPLE